MIVRSTRARQILQKSGLPGADYVVNPYVGCQHACVYCYARFMKRFTGHNEPWGQFVDVKENAAELAARERRKARGKRVLLSSVTDPYQPLEAKEKLTRRILRELVFVQASLCVLTKSRLVERDVDVLKKFKDCVVAVSVCTLDEKTSRLLEPGASSSRERLKALQALYEQGVRTAVFVSPIMPGVTDWKQIIGTAEDFADEFWFENLNLYPSVKENLFKVFRKHFPELIPEYEKIYSSKREYYSEYWGTVEKEIREYCKRKGINHEVYFHHRGKTKYKV